jgi:hypothetical protein
VSPSNKRLPFSSPAWSLGRLTRWSRPGQPSGRIMCDTNLQPAGRLISSAGRRAETSREGKHLAGILLESPAISLPPFQ